MPSVRLLCGRGHTPLKTLKSLPKLRALKASQGRKLECHERAKDFRATADQISSLKRKINRTPGVGRQPEILLDFNISTRQFVLEEYMNNITSQ